MCGGGSGVWSGYTTNQDQMKEPGGDMSNPQSRPDTFQPNGPAAYQTGVPAGGPPPQQTPPAPPTVNRRNTLGIVAFVASVLGFIFAVVEGAYLLGWLLLPFAFVLSLVAMFQKHQSKKLAVAALIISIVGTVAGAVAFLSSAATAIDDAFGETSTVVVEEDGGDASEAESPVGDGTQEDQDGAVPAEGVDEEQSEVPDSAAVGEAGTRSNPHPLGTTVASSDWEVTVNSFVPDATDLVLAENQFNDEPEEGTVYAQANVTIRYTGAESGTRFEVGFHYVTADGNVISESDAFVVGPDDLSHSELYAGAESTGNITLQVPVGDDGLLRVSPGFFADEVFYMIS